MNPNCLRKISDFENQTRRQPDPSTYKHSALLTARLMNSSCQAQTPLLRGHLFVTVFALQIQVLPVQAVPSHHVSHSSGLAQTILQGTVKGGKKIRQTEEEGVRQHQGMDRPEIRQIPEGRGEQGKMEETVCEVICGAPSTRRG